MAKYTEAKNVILDEMLAMLTQLQDHVGALDDIDRLEDYDLIDQIVSMDKKLEALESTLTRAKTITNPAEELMIEEIYKEYQDGWGECQPL